MSKIYQLDGDESLEELRELKKESEVDSSREDEEKKTGIYLWLKTRAYISDEKRIEKGLYQLEEMYPRLEKAGAAVCEIFEGKIPSRKLTEIARRAGVNSDDYEEDEELLKVLLVAGVREF